MARVKLEGFKELEKNLMKLEKVTQQRSVVRKALDDSAKHIVDDARSRVKHKGTRDSIKMSGKLNRAQARLEKSQRESKTEVTRFLGSNSPLAHVIEFGTAPRINGGKFKGTYHKGTAPKPFLRNSWEAGKEQALRNLKDTLANRISKAVTRQNKRTGKG